eukprot:14725051-Heterocapsa_arctica.AAC.1
MALNCLSISCSSLVTTGSSCGCSTAFLAVSSFSSLSTVAVLTALAAATSSLAVVRTLRLAVLTSSFAPRIWMSVGWEEVSEFFKSSASFWRDL